MITAADIAKLRAATGVGMMDCKKALEEATGDQEKAAEILRKKGIAKAAKRADKVASEGLVSASISSDMRVGALVEINSETDFVAKSDDFKKFSQLVAEAIVKDNPADTAALPAVVLSSGESVEAALNNLTLKLGEKIGVRRFVRYESAGDKVYFYLHGSKIGVLLKMEGGDAQLGLDVAMHVAASNPKYVNREAVDPVEVNKEKEIYLEQLKASGKPANILENIIKGKLEKFYGEICLPEQPFIKNEDLTVGKLLAEKGASVKRFTRFELGEGIAKAEKDFAAEVAEQMK